MKSGNKLKKVVIVSPHFPPSNLTAGHRIRFFASNLPEFGWEPLIITLSPEYYEETLDPDLEALLPPWLEVVRTPALNTKPVRVVGDVGIRSLWWHYREIGKIIKKRGVDLLYISIPSNYSSILGPLIHKRYGIPYAIDFQDPWVHHWPGSEKPLTKAWFSYKLGKYLEPWVLRNVSFITSVAHGYYSDVLKRYSWIVNGMHFPIPLGAEEADFKFLDENPRIPFFFPEENDSFNFVYAGAMLPRAYYSLECLFEALVQLKKESVDTFKKLRFYFIGTGKSPNDMKGYNIKPIAERYGLEETVIEHPARIAYLDSINHLKHSSALLVLGSDEPHYTPSKLFLALQAKKPILGILHSLSDSVSILHDSGSGVPVVFDNETPKELLVERIKEGILQTFNWGPVSDSRNSIVCDAFSARSMARILAGVFDKFV